MCMHSCLKPPEKPTPLLLSSNTFNIFNTFTNLCPKYYCLCIISIMPCLETNRTKVSRIKNLLRTAACEGDDEDGVKIPISPEVRESLLLSAMVDSLKGSILDDLGALE